jgi:N-glycosyltransferase
MPTSFFGTEARFPPSTQVLRHVDAPRPTQPVPAWCTDLRDRPTVLASLGTVSFRTPGLYDAIVRGLAHEELDLVIGVGHDRDAPAVARPTPTVHVEPTLPLPALLPDSALFLTHGGFNSIKEAVSAGTPMLIVPIASDQHYSADRAEALGIARVVRPHERTPDRIRQQALAVLGDPAYRPRAAALAAEMAALPPIDHGVTMLEALGHGTRDVP